MTKISWLTLFKEIIAVYSEKYTKHINTLWAKCGMFKELKKSTDSKLKKPFTMTGRFQG
jgi:hypothetical protein